MAEPSMRERVVRDDHLHAREPAADRIAPAGPSRREQIATVAGLNALAGIWLIIAPFVIGYGSGDPRWNDIVFGALIAVVGAARSLFALRQAWLSWLNMLFGAWVFAAAFWLDDTARAMWNDIIVGAIVFLLGLIAASLTRDARAR